MPRKSFTFIEIMIAMSIIIVLLSFSLTIGQSSRARARDVQRKQDLQAIKLATVLYKQQHGAYINFPGHSPSQNADCTLWTAQWGVLRASLQPYLTELPTDPSVPYNRTSGTCSGGNHPWHGPDSTHVYVYQSTGTQYSVWAALENKRDSDRNNSVAQNDPTGGKFSNLYGYNEFNNNNTNLQNLYGVGCRVVNSSCYDN